MTSDHKSPAGVESACTCRRCSEEWIESGHGPTPPLEGINGVWWMVLCETCGNKRCPHASDHRFSCTNSNEPGRPGSDYGPPSEAPTPPAGGEREAKAYVDFVARWTFPERAKAFLHEEVHSILINHPFAKDRCASVARATALNEEIKRVLEPFARHADLWIEMGDTRPVTISDGHTLFVRDLRAAGALLKKMGETG